MHTPHDLLQYSVVKRDGSRVPFNADRITNAISQAARATQEFEEQEGRKIAAAVVHFVIKSKKAREEISVEEIQDVVEFALMNAGHYRTARAYIVYREKRASARNTENVVVEVEKTFSEYLHQSDWRVHENANQGYSLGGLILNTSGKITANYWLNYIYPKEVRDAHCDGDLHIHDLGMFSGYCAGWSLRQLLEEGFNGVPGKVESSPPRHLETAVAQMVNFLGTLQNEWAGAQAFSSFDTYLAPFIRKDSLQYREVKQAIQQFVFNLNVPSRWGTQCVDEETECLTNNGWKKYNEISKKDTILTFDVQKKQYEYLTPLKVIHYDFDGEMYVLTNRTQEQWITPLHKVVRKKFNMDTYELLEIEKVLELQSPIIIPNSWETNSQKKMNLDMIRLLAWVVAEGNFDTTANRKRISLFQSEKNADHIDEIKGILKRLGYSYHAQRRTMSGFSDVPSVRIRLNEKGSHDIFSFMHKKVVPSIIKTLSVDCIRLFLETYIKGDGSEEESGRIRIYTKDRENFDALQELCVLSGFGSTLYQRKETGVFVLNIIRNKETYIQKIEKRHYKGKVWCPTTRNGTFVARRKGKTFITGNTPFTNITLDWVCPDDMKNKNPIIGGEEQAFTYGECQQEMDLINRVFIEVMTGGDWRGRIFTFPIPTYNITKDFDWDNENAEKLFEMTAKYGIPYFQNFINSNLNPSDVRSMCCRLQLDLRELRIRGGGLFGSAEMTGSVGVVTINLPRIGYLARTRQEFFDRLSRLMDISKQSLEIKRKVVQENIDRGLFPFTKRYLSSLNNHFSTIGLNGMNEACMNMFGKDIATPEGRQFACDVLEYVRKKLADYQEETGVLYNLEATPGEGVTYRFAKEDALRFPGIVQAGTSDAPYYTNSSHLPVSYTEDPFFALEHQDDLQVLYTGGTVLHLFLGERVDDWRACRDFVKKVATNFRLPYFTVTPTFSVCPTHGYISGEVYTCAQCGKECEVWSRIVGYFRPLKQWNKGKKSEFGERLEYTVPESGEVGEKNENILATTTP